MSVKIAHLFGRCATKISETGGFAETNGVDGARGSGSRKCCCPAGKGRAAKERLRSGASTPPKKRSGSACITARANPGCKAIVKRTDTRGCRDSSHKTTIPQDREKPASVTPEVPGGHALFAACGRFATGLVFGMWSPRR